MDEPAVAGDVSGTPWSSWCFQTQLLPGTVPVAVHVMERFDAARAARHERCRRAYRDAVIRSVAMPACCPHCGHGLVAAAQARPTADTAGTPPPAEQRQPILPRHLPQVLMTQVVEAMSGRRPVSQLARVAEPNVLRYVRVELHRARRTAAPTLRTLHVQHDGDRVAELCGLLGVGRRRLAYCARLDLTARGWRLTSLRVLRGGTAGVVDPVSPAERPEVQRTVGLACPSSCAAPPHTAPAPRRPVAGRP